LRTRGRATEPLASQAWPDPQKALKLTLG